MSHIKIILDTDIGDDIDDVLALGYILKNPVFELMGITTVFGNAALRGRLAQTVLKAAGVDKVPVATGCGAYMSPAIDMPVDVMKNYLDNVRFCQADAISPDAESWPFDSRHAVEFLIETIMQGDGDITIVTIGAMTNLGMAIAKEPRIAAKIPKVVSMAGVVDHDRINADYIDPPMAEWNVRCDPVAAAIVFNAGFPVDMVGLDVTTHVRFKPEDIERLGQKEDALSCVLVKCLDLFHRHSGHDGSHRQGPIMHDPLAVISMTEPDVVQWRQGRIAVDTNWGGNYGVTSFAESGQGKHRYAATVDVEKAMKAYLEKVIL